MFESLLVDLVQMAEAPLAPAHGWLGRQLGCDVDMRQFLRLVDSLLQRDILQLWHVEQSSGDRTELFAVPEALADQYLAEALPMMSYDPFGLSLTLGPAADPVAAPDWEVDLDMEGGTFELTAFPDEVEAALTQIRRLYPDLELLPETQDQVGDRTQIVGRLYPRWS